MSTPYSQSKFVVVENELIVSITKIVLNIILCSVRTCLRNLTLAECLQRTNDISPFLSILSRKVYDGGWQTEIGYCHSRILHFHIKPWLISCLVADLWGTKSETSYSTATRIITNTAAVKTCLCSKRANIPATVRRRSTCRMGGWNNPEKAWECWKLGKSLFGWDLGEPMAIRKFTT